MSSAVVIHSVSFSYPNGKTVLRHLDMEIASQGFVGITGTNGSGKTTLAYLLNGLIPHSIEGKLEGKVLINGISTKSSDIASLSRMVGFVFQNPDYALFNLTVEEEMLFGIKNFQLKDPESRVKRYLELVGMSDYRFTDPKTLSFGQKQKVNLACVLALETPIIVLDEPSAMLDYKSSIELYMILRKLHNDGRTVIVIEHDTDFLLTFTQTTIVIDKGNIVCFDKTPTVFRNQKQMTKLGIKIPHKLSI